MSKLWTSLSIATKNRQQFIQPDVDTVQVANVSPMDSIGVVTKMVVGVLLQLSQFGVDSGSFGELGIKCGSLGIHYGRLLTGIVDSDIYALFGQDAK